MKRDVLKLVRFASAAACALTALAIAGPANAAAAADNATTNPASASSDAAQIERGAYLAKAADCAGCHTAAPRVPHPGAAPVATPPFAGGLGMGSPFGTIYTSNITPDPQYGIGRYSYDDFARVLREGDAIAFESASGQRTIAATWRGVSRPSTVQSTRYELTAHA